MLLSQSRYLTCLATSIGVPNPPTYIGRYLLYLPTVPTHHREKGCFLNAYLSSREINGTTRLEILTELYSLNRGALGGLKRADTTHPKWGAHPRTQIRSDRVLNRPGLLSGPIHGACSPQQGWESYLG